MEHVTHPIVDRLHFGEQSLTALARTFASDDAVVISQLLPPHIHAWLLGETERLQKSMRVKDFVMPGFETPRIMSVLGATDLLAGIPHIRTLYERLADVAAEIVGSPIAFCQHARETMVLNRLEGTGRTHGWHLDDPAFALVLIIRGLEESDGGNVEYIPRWAEECRKHDFDPDAAVDVAVAALRRAGKVCTLALRGGDAYLLRADTSLHRVAPVTNPNAVRVVLNFAYEVPGKTSYAGTADLLYA